MDKSGFGTLNHETLFLPQAEWMDRLGILRLDEDRRVEIELDRTPMEDKFCCYRVRVVSKTHGEITKKTFHFRDYLEPEPSPTNHSANRIMPEFPHIWDNRGKGTAEWYIWKPKTVTPLRKAIKAFIKFYE